MSLYIANTSKQIFEFHFRLPEKRQTVVVKIRPGQQENIYPQGSRDVHEYIVEQHRVYGLLPVNEIDRTKAFVGQCYQFDKPIQVDRLMSNFQRNDEWMNEQALERRKEAAAATSLNMDKLAQESDSEVVALEIDVVEQRRAGSDDGVAERIEIDNGRNTESRRRGRPRRDA